MATGTGRLPSVRTATTKAIKAARDADRIKPHHEPYIAVAMRLAASFSPQKLSIAELIRLSGELDKALSRLPLAETTTEPGGASGDRPATPTSGPGPDSAHAPGLASGVGAGPEMGDTALPR